MGLKTGKNWGRNGRILTQRTLLQLTWEWLIVLIGILLITSAEGGNVFTLVCLSVWLSVKIITEWKSCERILTKFLGGVGHGPGTNEFNFSDESGSLSGSRSPKSEIRIHWIIKKVTNGFWWNLWRASVWPRDQHFGDDPHHYPDLGVRYIAKIIQQLLRWRSAGVCALWVLLV